ncbi:MAG TPA: Trm112 family protein [Edaphobacter sp.]|nr:Trm112 family protein [Edaphobacter sp.]
MEPKHPASAQKLPPKTLTSADLRLLVCPACHHSFDLIPEALLCRGCHRRYPIVDGIPVLLTTDLHG